MILNERRIEYAFVFKSLTKINPKRCLDVGTGLTALPALVGACGAQITGIDSNKQQIKRNCFLKPVYDNILAPKRIKGKFDFITCISVLEHIKDYKKAINNMKSLLIDKGHLLLTFPYNSNKYIPNAYRLPNAGYGRGSKSICQIFNENTVIGFEMKAIDVEIWQVFTGEYWTVGKRLPVPRQVDIIHKHQLGCFLLRKK